jgi:Zn-dependent protease
MIGAPGATAFDLRFRLLGIPVRISPYFWLLAAFLSWEQGIELPFVLVRASCILISILVHEFGHGLSSLLFRARVEEIVLYQVGGVTIHQPVREFGKRLAIVVAGPAAGIALWALTLLVTFGLIAAGQPIRLSVEHVYRWIPLPLVSPLAAKAELLAEILNWLLFINLVWSLFNLLPIWPLDGGQILGILLGHASPRNGARWTHTVGLVAAGLLAVLLFSRQAQGESYLFLGIMMALIAFDNYQFLQILHQRSRFGDDSFDDADWWKR